MEDKSSKTTKSLSKKEEGGTREKDPKTFAEKTSIVLLAGTSPKRGCSEREEDKEKEKTTDLPS